MVPQLMELIATKFRGSVPNAIKKGNVEAESLLPGNATPAIDEFGLSNQGAVLGLDNTGRLSEDEFIIWWRKAKEDMPLGVYWALMWTVMIGTWPVVPHPVPPYHNV